MRKMNNKGFAISSLLYGLLIVGFLVMTLLLSVMATNRKNTSVLIDKIEEELGRYGRTNAEFDIDPSGNAQQFIVPYNKAGWYKIELWHKKDSENKYRYLSAVVELAENQHLNFEVKDDSTKVIATSKGTTQILLEVKDYTPADTIGGTGVIDSGTIEVRNVLNIPTSENITTKAKIQLLGTDEPPNADFDGTFTYTYYLKDVDHNFVEAQVVTNPDGTKTGTAFGTRYDDMKFMKWVIEKNEDGTYKIVNTNSNLALYDDGTGYLKLTEIKPDDAQQKWIITSPASNNYTIQNIHTSKYLNVDSSSAGTIDNPIEAISLIKADY